MSADNKRGQSVALFGLAIQVAAAGVLCLTWLFTGNDGAGFIFHLLLGGIGIWTVTAVVFYCRHLAELEKLELDELSRQGGPGIFGEQANELRLAQRRLDLVTRFFVPISTLIICLYLMCVGVFLLVHELRVPDQLGRTDGSLTWAFVCLGCAFAAFLASRYAVGMARDPRWRLLRAGGSFLAACALVVALECLSLFLVQADFLLALSAMPYIATGVMILLGLEMGMNLVLDLYRPRKPGVESRPAFDSRLANLLSEPGSLAHSIAEALNYQFGFEVSRTWFYQLLQKTLLPLTVFGLAALLAASSVVLVSSGRQGIVLSFGRPPAEHQTLSPGLHFKWPWPFQTAVVMETERIRSLPLGVGDIRESSGDMVNGVMVYTWDKEHGERAEYDFLVPRPTTQANVRQSPASAPATEPAVAAQSQPSEDQAAKYNSVGTVRIVASLEYRVVDPYRYLFGFEDAETVLKDIGQRALTQYAATHDIDALMSVRREDVDSALHARIAEEADRLNLGVKVIQVSLHGLHPPTEVAGAFEEVIKANEERRGKLFKAYGARETLLSETAGTGRLAVALADAAARSEAGNLSAEERAAAQKEAWRLMENCRGRLQQIIGAAQANRWKTANKGRGFFQSYQHQLAAWSAAKQVYELNELLQVYKKAMDGSRKYILGIDPKNVQIRQQDDRRSAGGVFSGTQ